MIKSNSKNIYEPYFKELRRLFNESRKQENPALWLYNNKARDSLFMIESLARLHASVSPGTEVKKLHKFSKKLEDLLGQVDYYIVTLKTFSKNKLIKEKELSYFRKKRNAFEEKLNEKLLLKDYYLPRIRSFESTKINFDSADVIKILRKHIKNELAEGAAFFNQYSSGFTDMESQVHELRRKLRWLSIYAQSLQGRVILRKDPKRYQWEKKFIKAGAVNSQYNKVPRKISLKEHIIFNDKAFYAINACVTELGVIKDKALEIQALAKCHKKTTTPKPTNAKAIAQKILGIKSSEEELIKQAHSLLHEFYHTYKIHTLLCHGVK